MKILLPEDVKHIIETLTENGYEAYAVGGCVRDSIIHRVPGDWDITTSATPEQVKFLFRRTVDTGIEHGTVTIMIGKEGYEVTTFRVDGEYEDSRHPKAVEFTASLKEDLQRRDFTINAMAYNHEVGIVDLFGGQEDLAQGVIRCVGDPVERFGEDALRMLRAVRFSAQLGFVIEIDTKRAIQTLCATIDKISKERIHTELNKILLSQHPEYLALAEELGICGRILKEFHEIEDQQTPLAMVKAVPKRLDYGYGALLYPVGEIRTRQMLKELKLDNATVNGAARLVKYHGINIPDSLVEIRKQASQIGPEVYPDILEFEGVFYATIGQKDMVQSVKRAVELFGTIQRRGDCLGIAQLAINGQGLIQLGVTPGKHMGQMLKELLSLVLENPELNQEEILQKIVTTKLLQES